MAVGEDGALISSADGIQWQAQSRFTTEHLNRVAWFAGEFWALGEAGGVFVSAAGSRNWSAQPAGAVSPIDAFAGLNAMRLVAGDNEVRLRTNAISWSDQLAPTNRFLHRLDLLERDDRHQLIPALRPDRHDGGWRAWSGQHDDLVPLVGFAPQLALGCETFSQPFPRGRRPRHHSQQR